MPNSERCSENSPKLSGRTPRMSALRTVWCFLYGLGGKAVLFFFLCFLCLVRCLLSFFSVLLFLGSLFGTIFGSELLFLSVVVGLVFFDSVLPRFLFYYLVFRSRKCLGIILLMSGPLFEKFFGSELLFFASVLVVCFCAVLPMFLLYYLIFSLPKISRKNSLDVRSCVSVFLGCVFSFSGAVSRRLPLCFSKVLSVLAFSGRIFGNELWRLRGGRWWVVFWWEFLVVCPFKIPKKIQFVLGYVFQKFAPKIFFRTLLGKSFGCELVLGAFSRVLPWIFCVVYMQE